MSLLSSSVKPCIRRFLTPPGGDSQALSEGSLPQEVSGMMGGSWAAGKERWHPQLSEAGGRQRPRGQRNKTFLGNGLSQVVGKRDEIHKQKGLFQQPLRSAQLPSPQELPFLGAKMNLESPPFYYQFLEGVPSWRERETVKWRKKWWQSQSPDPSFVHPSLLVCFPEVGGVGVGSPDLVNINTGHPVQFQFQINNK